MENEMGVCEHLLFIIVQNTNACQHGAYEDGNDRRHPERLLRPGLSIRFLRSHRDSVRQVAFVIATCQVTG